MTHQARSRPDAANGCPTALVTPGVDVGGQRHPLIAAAIVLPMAVILAVVFGGVEAVVTQASSVVGMLGS